MSKTKTGVRKTEKSAQIVEGFDPFVGKTIGHCRVLEKLAEGGTALVYKSHNLAFDLPRVIKILKPSLMRESEFFTNFKQEAQLTARLDHPNILRVFDTGEYEGYFFIEADYIEGQTLREYLFSKKKMSESEILTLALQIIGALRYAHEANLDAKQKGAIRGILHRDIKPENIMINADKKIYLMDFGAAKPLHLTSETTQTLAVGTLHYMSPEQISGDPLDARSDFFSLGIVLYELFSGRKPFESENLAELIGLIRESKYTPLRKLRPSISPLTEELIEKLLSKKPKYRHSTAAEIESEMRVCYQAYHSWGSGRKVRVPFSFTRAIPMTALILSLIALLLSAASLWKISSDETGFSWKKLFGIEAGSLPKK